MTKEKRIVDRGTLIAIVLPKKLAVPDGVTFFTQLTNSFQIGLHNRKKGIALAPHVHKQNGTIPVGDIQEVLVVLSGKIELTLYTDKGKFIKRMILSTGDSVLLVSGGHGVTFLTHARVLEIKQGPYPGAQNAKIYFHPLSHA